MSLLSSRISFWVLLWIAVIYGSSVFLLHMENAYVTVKENTTNLKDVYVSAVTETQRVLRFMCFCLELHHSVQRKKQMKMMSNSCTYHENCCKSSQKHRAAKSVLFRWLLTKVIWMGQRKVKLKKQEHLSKLQKVFSLLSYMYVVTAVHDFFFMVIFLC